MFPITAILTLGLTIGATSAIFGLLNALLFRPLPVKQPDQLIRIGSRENNGMIFPVPGDGLQHLRQEPFLSGVCGIQTPLLNVVLNGTPFPAGTHALTGDCYRTLGVHAALGRLFTLADDEPTGLHVAVLGYTFWQERFGGDPSVLGRVIRIENVPFTIIGVTERRFHGLLLGFPPGISFPISQLPENKKQDSPPFYWADVLARLRPGATAGEVRAILAVQWRRLLGDALPTGRFQGAQRAELLSMPPVVISGAAGLDYTLRDRFRRPLAILLAISGLVLLSACTSIANLLLGRGLERRYEIAIRLALGATRNRIVRQLATESVLLLVCGFGAALAFSAVADHVLLRVLGTLYPGLSVEAGLDGRVLAFTSGSALIGLLLFGILPAWRNSDPNAGQELNLRASTPNRQSTRLRQFLISGQVSLTTVLLVGAALLVGTLRNLRAEPLGFDAHRVLDVQLMPLPANPIPKPEKLSYFTGLLTRIRQLPHTLNASLASFRPLSTLPYKEDIYRLDEPNRPLLLAPAEFVSDGFFQTMHIPLLQGRDFQVVDHSDARRTAIVSRSLAQRLFPHTNPVGRHIRFGSEADTKNLQIVGVVADARLEDPWGKESSFLYLNLWQLPKRGDWGALQIRYSGDPGPVVKALGAELRRTGHQSTLNVYSLTEQRELSLLQQKLLAWFGLTFGLLGLTLTAIGLLGLLNFLVTARRKEIGLRIALGASPRSICWLVTRELYLVIGAGIILGLPLSSVSSRLLSGFLYGAAPSLLLPLLSSLLLLNLVGGLAALVPVYRASSIDPVRVLRQE